MKNTKAKKRIYFDYAATTPVDKAVIKAMLPYYTEKYGNSASIHSMGTEANKAVDKARETIANYLNFFRYGCPPHGGLGIGPARMMIKMLGLSNIREVTYLYRGVKRLEP